MDIIDFTFCPGNRSQREWSESLLRSFAALATAIRLSDDHVGRSAMRYVCSRIPTLIYSECISRIEIQFADVECRVHIDLQLRDVDADAFDFAVLEHVDWKVEQMRIALVVTDVDYATSLFGDWPEEFRAGGVELSVMQEEPVEAAEPAGEGG